MEDLQVMKRFKSFCHLNQYIPDIWLRNEHSLLLALDNLLEEITVIDKLHDDAEIVRN
jgi:hypothetical protein